MMLAVMHKVLSLPEKDLHKIVSDWSGNFKEAKGVKMKVANRLWGGRDCRFVQVFSSCRNRGIDPQTYLREVLTRLPTLINRQIKEVTSEAWAKAQPASTQRKTA